ncbi:MAG: TetR/AcrR family transcriptional regulator [Clostridia bacterium]|nr:TetR/AcrR family transcriptional regulator [Clostridia bacterium]
MNKNESKYFNTAIKMDKALLSLLERKDFEYISVKEICEEAGVNRSTFYLHYENTSDLLQETTRYVLDGFLSYFSFDKESITARFGERSPEELVFITPKYIIPYLTFIKDNRRIFKTSLKEFGSMGFDRVYEKMYRYIFDPILERFGYSEQSRPYVMKFYLSGITAIVMEWIENGCEDDIDTMSEIITYCVFTKKDE